MLIRLTHVACEAIKGAAGPRGRAATLRPSLHGGWTRSETPSCCVSEGRERERNQEVTGTVWLSEQGQMDTPPAVVRT